MQDLPLGGQCTQLTNWCQMPQLMASEHSCNSTSLSHGHSLCMPLSNPERTRSGPASGLTGHKPTDTSWSWACQYRSRTGTRKPQRSSSKRSGARMSRSSMAPSPGSGSSLAACHFEHYYIPQGV
uniref:Uncharacterized protein n=1 Tax=Pipistrellus kuhlii TaxID=59472 RepID=A0A7J7YM88_PIPKU|nr:hypothetical protein mPipKuh1_010100 [Pipistrellus kuhlii]